MSEKIYYNSGFLNKVREKKSDKAPDYRANITLDQKTLQELCDNGGKLQIAGWLKDFGKVPTVSLLASADNYSKPQEPEKANAYVVDKDEDSIPF